MHNQFTHSLFLPCWFPGQSIQQRFHRGNLTPFSGRIRNSIQREILVPNNSPSVLKISWRTRDTRVSSVRFSIQWWQSSSLIVILHRCRWFVYNHQRGAEGCCVQLLLLSLWVSPVKCNVVFGFVILYYHSIFGWRDVSVRVGGSWSTNGSRREYSNCCCDRSRQVRREDPHRSDQRRWVWLYLWESGTSTVTLHQTRKCNLHFV